MTTAFAQEQAQQPSSAQDRQEQPSDTVSQIPVLIRLPDLATSTITVQAGSQLESDGQKLSPSSEVVQTAGNAGLEQPAPKAEREAATPELSRTPQRQEKDVPWWSEFRVPSSVIHAAVALALIAVFVVAYMAIVGGGDNAQEVAADKPAANQEEMASNASNGKASAQEDSTLDFDSFVPDAPQKPAAKPKQPPAKKPAAAATKQLAANPGQPSAKKPPAATGAPAVAANQQASSIQQAEFKSPAGKPPLSQVQTDRPQGFRNENPAPQDLAANNLPANDPSERPRVSGTAGSAANQSANSPPMYPMTNPASYQYPADYHERLLSPADAQGSPPSSPWFGGGGGGDERPSTARLQSRIEPPPVR